MGATGAGGAATGPGLFFSLLVGAVYSGEAGGFRQGEVVGSG